MDNSDCCCYGLRFSVVVIVSSLFCLRSWCVPVFGFIDRLQCLCLLYVIIVVVIALFSSTLFESFFRRAFVFVSSLVCLEERGAITDAMVRE